MKSCTGHCLYTVKYIPQNNPICVLCFHHGLHEHIGRYDDIFTKMADAGIGVISFDAIGHGKSGGQRGYIPKFRFLIDDFEAVCTAAAASEPLVNFPSVSYFIGGHSMGGLVAASTSLRNQTRWSGLLISAPALGMEWTPILRVQAAIGNFLSLVVPKARIVPAVDPMYLNRDPQRCREYVEDPLCIVGNVRARTGNQALKAIRKLRRQWMDIGLPVYAHHGTEDRIVPYSVTK